MIIAIGLSLAADRELLGQRDAGDAEQKPKHEKRAEDRGPSIRAAKGEEEEGDPDQGLEEIVRMPGITPESLLANLATVGRIGLELLRLPVGQGFPEDGQDAQRKTGPFDWLKAWSGIERGKKKGP